MVRGGAAQNLSSPPSAFTSKQSLLTAGLASRSQSTPAPSVSSPLKVAGSASITRTRQHASLVGCSPPPKRPRATSRKRLDSGHVLTPSQRVSRESVDSARLALHLSRSLSSLHASGQADHGSGPSFASHFHQSAGKMTTVAQRHMPDMDAVALMRPDREIKDEPPPFVVQPASASSPRPMFDGRVDDQGEDGPETQNLARQRQGTTPSHYRSDDVSSTAEGTSSQSAQQFQVAAAMTPNSIRSASGVASRHPGQNALSSSPNSTMARNRKPSSAEASPHSRSVSKTQPQRSTASGFSASQRSVSAHDFGPPMGMAPKTRSRLPSSVSHDPASSLPLAAHLVPEIKEYTVPKGMKWDDAPIPTVARRLEKERLEREEQERQEEEARRRQARVEGKENAAPEAVSLASDCSWTLRKADSGIPLLLSNASRLGPICVHRAVPAPLVADPVSRHR